MAAIATMDDIREFEKIPLSSRNLPKSTFEAISRGAAHGLERPALSFFLQAKGDAFMKPEVYSYGDFLGNIRQVANMFRDLGIKDHDVVSFVLPNLPETHFTIWGGEYAGIVNPINPLLEPHVIKEILQAAGTKVLVTLSSFPNTDLWEKIDAIRHEVPTLKTILRINLEDHLSGVAKVAIKGLTFFKRQFRKVEGQRILDFNQNRKAYPKENFLFERDIQPDDIASYFHTGGTTGTPKLAMHTHGNEVFDAWAGIQAMDLNTPDKKFFCGLPLFHVNGVLVTGLGPFGNGAHVVLATPQGYRGEGVIPNFWRIVDHYKLNFFSGVPTVYSALLNVPIGNSKVDALDFAICGAAPMPVEVFKQFERYSGVKIIEGYGCTEGACASSVNPAYGDRRVGSVGFPFPYQEMKILVLNEEGKFDHEGSDNEIGLVCIRGANVFPGYKEEIHNKNIWVDIGDGKGPFYNTGDLGRKDEEGYFWLTGRKKELIIRGGHNIDPKLIEDPLTTHPHVEMVAAVPRPDARVGEIPVAYVKLKPGSSVSKEALLTYAMERIGERAAIPKRIQIVDELPVTAVGKIFKPTLVYQEIKDVYTQEVKNLSPVQSVEVQVGPHKTLGMLAEVRVKAKPEAKPEGLKNEIERVLGAYAPKFKVEVIS
ncbi:MAG: acyl-CoA synthetase [Bacteroidota bacterium]